MKLFILLCCLVGYTLAQSPSPYTYVCENQSCLRRLRSKVNPGEGMPMEVCKLRCAEFGSLWPKPTGQVTLGPNLFSFPPASVVLDNLRDNPVPIQDMLSKSVEIFQGYLNKMAGATGDDAKSESASSAKAPGNSLHLRITVADGTTEIGWATDESYTLQVDNNFDDTRTATIQARTYFGARHAIETLSQLIAFNDESREMQMVSPVSIIDDKPIFHHRGVHLDTARNYIPLDKIKTVIDGMSYSKLNVFHWHIVDSQSFPMEVESRPKMQLYGKYRDNQVYSKADILDVVQYAKQRGIKVIPELDQPAHSGYGYNWGVEDGLGNLVVCVENDPWSGFCVQPNCGQLNIVNDNVTVVVGDIVRDMMAMFDQDVFHYGGDEIDFRCYNSTQEITDWMTQNGYARDVQGFLRLWSRWQDIATAKLLEASGKDTQVILWTSDLTDPAVIENYLDKERYIIQIWSESTDDIIGGLLQKGYRTIFTNVDALYLDCGWPAWIAGASGHNWCSPMKGWQTVYDNNPEAIYAKWVGAEVAAEAVRSGQIVGGETALWAEQLDGNSVESRLFPRVSAHAERMWSHPSTGFDLAWGRMLNMRYRLVNRGINADQITEDYCHQYEGKCHT